MKKFYVFIEGSNDLFYPINRGLHLLLSNIRNIGAGEVDIIYSLENVDFMNLWRRVDGEFLINKSSGLILIKDGEFSYLQNNKYIKEVIYNNKSYELMNIARYLSENMRAYNENIVVISGHGGPFQCLLNMNQEYPVSLNTRILCEELSCFNIDLLFLDMCAMNYIDTIYELIYKNKIKNIITYKGLAPYDYQDYITLINVIGYNDSLEKNIKKYFYSSNVPLIYLNYRDFHNLSECKEVFNTLANICFNGEVEKFDYEIDKLKMLLKSGIHENLAAKTINGVPLKFFRYYLDDEIDRCIFNNYKFESDGLYRYLVSKKETRGEPIIVPLSEESLEHIIELHNPNFNGVKLNKVKKEFLLNYS